MVEELHSKSLGGYPALFQLAIPMPFYLSFVVPNSIYPRINLNAIVPIRPILDRAPHEQMASVLNVDGRIWALSHPVPVKWGRELDTTYSIFIGQCLISQKF